MTVPIWPDRLFDKTADLSIVSDSLGFPDIVRLKSESFVHLDAALTNYKQFDDQNKSDTQTRNSFDFRSVFQMQWTNPNP